MKYLIAFMVVTPLFWLIGTYIQFDWLWFLHIRASFNRVGILMLYIFIYTAFASCPMIFDWED